MSKLNGSQNKQSKTAILQVKQQQQRDLELIRQIVGDNPELTAQLLQKWLKEDEKS